MYFGFDRITAAYGRGKPSVLRELTLPIAQGEIVALLGPNGCGKSTLLRTVPRLLRSQSGRVIYRDAPLSLLSPRKAAQKIAYLAQSHTAPPDLPVRTLVGYGRYPHGHDAARDAAILNDTLKRTGLTGLADRPLSALSGGERQRAWIAMAVCQQPEILLLDEPTTHLDIGYQLEVLELVRSLRDELGITVLMVLHDLNLAARYADRLCAMRDGRIVADGSPRSVLSAAMLRDVFGISADIYHDSVNDCPYFIPLQHEKTP